MWTDDKLSERFDRIDTRFDEVDGRLDKIDHRLDRLGDRFDALQRTLLQTNVVIIAALVGVIATQL